MLIELVDQFTKKSYGYFDNVDDVPHSLIELLSMSHIVVKEIKDFDQYINEKEVRCRVLFRKPYL